MEPEKVGRHGAGSASERLRCHRQATLHHHLRDPDAPEKGGFSALIGTCHNQQILFFQITGVSDHAHPPFQSHHTFPQFPERQRFPVRQHLRIADVHPVESDVLH